MNREEDVTGPALRELRIQQGKSQEKFWGEVLVKGSTGAYYETERSPMSDLVRRVCYLHFVCGLDINMENPEKLADLLKQTADRVNSIASDMRETVKLLGQHGKSN